MNTKKNQNNLHVLAGLPKEFYDALPPHSSTNNARAYFSKMFRRLVNMKDQKKGAWLMQGMFGFDCDYIPGQDDGESIIRDKQE